MERHCYCGHTEGSHYESTEPAECVQCALDASYDEFEDLECAGFNHDPSQDVEV